MSEKCKNIASIAVMSVILLGFSIGFWLKGSDSFSYSERRVLAQMPEISFESITSGDFVTKFETYMQDQFPMRDGFRSIKAFSEFYAFARLDNNDIFLSEGHISKLEYPLREDSLERVRKKFNSIYEKYLRDNNTNIYLSVIPDKNMFLAEKNGYLSLDYDKLIETVKNNTEFAEYIDIASLLSLDDYYYTDTHWKQECIRDVADKIAEAMGVDISAEYEEKVLDNGFFGVYHGQSALNFPPDKLTYLTNGILDNCIVTNYDDMGMPVSETVYNMNKAQGYDAYEMFLSGAAHLIEIENPAASSERELVIFRDSYGSSITPLLVTGYYKITMVDLRYISSDVLGSFIDFEGCDVLFLYSTLVLNNASFK
jgi:hypothetical protein